MSDAYDDDTIAEFRKVMLAEAGAVMDRDAAVAALREAAAGEKRAARCACPKLHRDAFLYAEPADDCPDYAQCGTCFFFTGLCKCFLHGDEVVQPGASCGLYVHGEPSLDLAGMELPLVTPEQSGLVGRPVRCENCAHFEADEGECGLYENLNAAVPGAFDLDTRVAPQGCCNAQTPRGARVELSLAPPANGHANGKPADADVGFYQAMRAELAARAGGGVMPAQPAIAAPEGDMAAVRAAQRQLVGAVASVLARAKAAKKQDEERRRDSERKTADLSLSEAVKGLAADLGREVRSGNQSAADAVRDMSRSLAEQQARAFEQLGKTLADALARRPDPVVVMPRTRTVTRTVVNRDKNKLVQDFTQTSEEVADGEQPETEPAGS